jgi:hypothetical protein
VDSFGLRGGCGSRDGGGVCVWQLFFVVSVNCSVSGLLDMVGGNSSVVALPL